MDCARWREHNRISHLRRHGECSSDQRTRISLFAVNIKLGETASNVTAQAEDSLHHISPLPVEYVGTVPGLNWLTQIVVKLPDALINAGDVSVGINVRGVASNKALIKIRPS